MKMTRIKELQREYIMPSIVMVSLTFKCLSLLGLAMLLNLLLNYHNCMNIWNAQFSPFSKSVCIVGAKMLASINTTLVGELSKPW